MFEAYANKKEDFKSCTPDVCSFYDLIEDVFSDKNGIHNPLHRFCTLMRKMHAHTYLRETLIPNQELRDEEEMARLACKDKGVTLSAERFTFFLSPIEQITWDQTEEYLERRLIGYAVIVTLELPDKSKRSYLLEAIVRPPSVLVPLENDQIFVEPVTNYYVHNSKEHSTIIGSEDNSKTLRLKGSFFSQQNELTSSCAHAALRMAMNSSPMIDLPKLTNKQINDILGIDLKIQKDKGLTQEQIVKVVQSLGYDAHIVNFTDYSQIEYDHFLYPALESCCPTILGLQSYNTSHVVTVLGHTINSDRWAPEAQGGYGIYPIQPYIPSVSWCDHLIMGDDNYGIYSTLPTDMLRNLIVPTKNPNLHVSMGISIVPKEVVIPGYFAEQVAINFARSFINNLVELGGTWLQRMCYRDKKNGKLVCRRDLVCRTLLQKKEHYQRFIRANNLILSENQETCLAELPDYVWVSEISLPNVYTGNKHKLGDVVIRVNATPDEYKMGKSLAFAWVPGFVLLGYEREIEAWGIDSHVPLIRNAEKVPMLEW